GDKLRLVLACQLELAVLVLDFVKQADVLNSDHRLVGEGRCQLNLFVGERAHGGSFQGNDANRRSFSQERGAKKRTEAANLLARIRVLRIGQSVGDMNDFAFKQNAPGHSCSVDSSWVTGEVLSVLTREPIARLKVVSFALRSTYDDRVRLAKARR